jgi:hypothetical protein
MAGLELGPCQIKFGMPLRATARVNSTAYTLGQRITTTSGPVVAECVTAGTSAVSEPSYANKATGITVTDGTAVFMIVDTTNVSTLRQNSTAVVSGSRYHLAGNFIILKCIVPGTTAASLPTYTGLSTGTVVQDGTAVMEILASGIEDLGGTLGGVTLRIEDDIVDLKTDQYGTAAQDAIITGTTCEVEATLADISFLNLSKVLKQNLIGSAEAGVLGENKVGRSLNGDFYELQLIKYVNGAPSTDPADVIVFPNANFISNLELTFDANNQRVLKTKFKCFPMEVFANWGVATGITAKTVLYFFGNKSATS